MDSTWEVVARFSFPIEAQIAKGRLDAEGIETFVADEHTINMQWLYSDAMGGVRLWVPKTEISRAKAVLSEDHQAALDALMGESDSHNKERPRCPKCASSDVEPCTLGKRPAFLVFILLGFPLFFYRPGIHCNQCGKESPLPEP